MNEILQTIGFVFGPAGAAFVGVKVSMNGLKFRISELERKVEKVDDSLVGAREHLAQLSARVDAQAGTQ